MRKKPKKWNKYEIDFLKNNYNKTSCKYCAEKLNLPIDIVYGKIGRLKLTKECKYNIELFNNVENKYISYILGFLWADGYLGHNIMKLSIVKSDGEELIDIFDKIGYYKLTYLKERGKNKEKTEFKFCSAELQKIFNKYDFNNKSEVSPEKLLKIIPNNLKKYFYRGVIDGDGCFYINKKNYTYQFCVTSSYNQDWKYMIYLCENLGISKYKINRISRINKKTNKENKSSQFKICRKNDIKILGNYIYQEYDKIGLKRKHLKYKEIC